MAMQRIEPYWGLAGVSAAKAKVPQEWIYASWMLETGSFTSTLCLEYYNLGGLKKFRDYSRDATWQSFESLDDFTNYYGWYITQYPGSSTCKNVDEYLQCLKDGGYFQESIDYYGGIYKGILNGDNPVNPGGTGYTSTGGGGGSVSSKANNISPTAILKFAGFISSIAFQEALKSGFEASSESTLHNFLATFMQKFYHSIYYVPTLPSNKCIITKPETMFVNPPSCNVIYPSMRTSGGFSRQHRAEPTRILLLTDPVAKLYAAKSNDINNILTLAYIDYEDPKTKNKLVVKGLKKLKGEMDDISKPIGIISDYEKDNGVRILRTSRGADIYLFLMSEDKQTSASGKQKAQIINRSGKDEDAIADVLFKLASYELQRARYECRPGSYETYFNPYIVPGFPVINLENNKTTNLNVHAYCTDVTHQITDSGWHTSVSTTGTHVFPDPKPENFPIMEEEYCKYIDVTYKNMLGGDVKPVMYDTAMKTSIAKYNEGTGTATEAYKNIWRPLTTMAEHLAVVCDNAQPTVDANGTLICTGKFFDSSVQAKIAQYSADIAKGNAFSEADVR